MTVKRKIGTLLTGGKIPHNLALFQAPKDAQPVVHVDKPSYYMASYDGDVKRPQAVASAAVLIPLQAVTRSIRISTT